MVNTDINKIYHWDIVIMFFLLRFYLETILKEHRIDQRVRSTIEYLHFKTCKRSFLKLILKKFRERDRPESDPPPGIYLNSQVYISGNLYFSLSVYLSFYLSPWIRKLSTYKDQLSFQTEIFCSACFGQTADC